MRRSTLVAVLALVLVGAGLTVAWVSTPHLAVGTSGVAAVAQSGSADDAITDSGQSAVKRAIAAVGPAVVRVDVVSDVRDNLSELFSDPLWRRYFGVPDTSERESQGVGSGFAISYGEDKYVLTNAHVIEGAKTITLVDAAGDTWDAEVVGADDVVDVAVLRIHGATDDLATVVLGDSDLVETGDWAIAIGNPLGLSYTVTMGIISATGRDMAKPDRRGTFYDLIQTDAAINPGNSGGPLANARGEVIGINTMIARSTGAGVAVEGINFAVPINNVKAILNQLVESGEVKRGWLGVGIETVDADNAAAAGVTPDQPGAVVKRLFAGDPAERAGILVDDVIVRIGETTIEEAADVSQAVGRLTAGTTVEIGLLRGGQPLTVSVTLTERPSEAELANYTGSAGASGEAAQAAFGMSVGPITDVVARQLGLNSTEGVVIMEVARGGRAEQAGLHAGDIVLGVDQQAIDSVETWNSVVGSLGADDIVTLTVFRNGRLAIVRL